MLICSGDWLLCLEGSTQHIWLYWQFNRQAGPHLTPHQSMWLLLYQLRNAHSVIYLTPMT